MRCACCGAGPLWPSTAERRGLAPWRLLHAGRGLCSSCHSRADRVGTLLDWPRLTWSRAELVGDAELLRARGVRPWAKVAEQLGVSAATLERARCRESAHQRQLCNV